MTSRKREFFAGMVVELPIAIGGIPFGLIFGALALDAGLPPAEAQSMSAIVFAGSAQFIAVQLFGANTLGFIIILTTFVVNLRHFLYTASLLPHLRSLSRPWQWLLAYLLTDEAYAVTVIHYRQPGPSQFRHWYFLGAGLLMWLAWQVSTAVGIFLGARISGSWSLDFTLALTFIGLVVPALASRADLAAALSAGVVAVLAAGLPYRLGLMLAALTGIVVGVWVERRSGHLGLGVSTQ